MKKYIFTLFLALVSTFAAWAQDTETCVVVEFKSGEIVPVALSENPKAQFEGNEVVFTAENFEGRYVVTDVKRFYFDEMKVGIKLVEAADRKSKGVIYDVQGREVGKYEGTVDSTSLPVGTYVVKTEGGNVFKVVKK